ncbi:MAG: hypothetical protein KIT22_01095 [Verrucomicrobiae bacterium]|nr:hypothetical protein [Verrucomicrobiae bacterium]
MKTATCLTAFAVLFGILPSFAAAPGAPEDNGLVPVTETFYINTPDTINNNNTESLGIAIARNGNVLIGWEDDGDELSDLEAVWTLFGPDGTPLTQDTEISSVDPLFAGQVITSKFLSYFRADGSPTPGYTSWGPKIKANLFGDGIGMGATSFALADEVPELLSLQNNGAGENAGDYPAVQWLNNQGAPVRILTGVSDDYAERDGDIRIGDWEPLSTGNFAIVGESRQRQDLPEIYGGTTGEQTHVIVRIVDANGAEVKAVQLASDIPDKAEMWHGVGVTRNGFGVRFANEAGRATLRLFDNAGTPVSTNLDLGTLSGSEIMASGGRGDSVGFHGNGDGLYAAVASGQDGEGKRHVWVTVLNADGTLKWSKSVADDLELVGPGRWHVGISDNGSGVVRRTRAPRAMRASSGTPLLGEPDGGTRGWHLHISEKEPRPTTPWRRPGHAWPAATPSPSRGVFNSGFPENAVVAARFFGLPAKPGSIESVGLGPHVPDTVVINQICPRSATGSLYASVLGNQHLPEHNAYAEDSVTPAMSSPSNRRPAALPAMKRVRRQRHRPRDRQRLPPERQSGPRGRGICGRAR